MRWYEVTKKIKGHKYRYRQRTYRVGGKVKTESQYLGAESNAGTGSIPVTGLDEAVPGSIQITNQTPPSRPPGASKYEPNLRIDEFILARDDLSVTALYKEEQEVDALMRESGVNTTNLNPIRVKRDERVWQRERGNGFYVYGTYEGQRTAFKREYRRALAERWIDALREQQPERYAQLCGRIVSDFSWSKCTSHPHWFALLTDLWHQRRRGHRQAVDMLAEMIQRGAVETQAKYYVESGATEAVSERAWQRFRKLKQPAARQRHFVECQRLETISKELGQRHGEAIWVRAFVFDVRPLLPDAAIKSAKTKQRKKKSTTKKTHRYRRRRYPRWSR